LDRQRNDRLGRLQRQLFQHRREILRALWFAYSDRNCNTYVDTYCNAEIYAGSAIQAYPGTAPIADVLINRKSVIW
jgi:hypothetical protein